MEAKASQRAEYLTAISMFYRDQLVYLDESGIDHNCCKNRGWGKKGEVLLGKTSGKHYLRTNIIAAQCGNKILAPMTFNGTCNTDLFLQWLEQCLVKELKPGQVVIMDNAAFHKSSKVKEIIENAGCKLIYLPPYSPDLNPIEHFWANLKRWIKQFLPHLKSKEKAIQLFFQNTSST